ncbi:MAG: hypothetical protein K2X03_10280 [Bryobacteraceae bacterium]|nr:hypothetical protein [Bryobacteraceae bacterium]
MKAESDLLAMLDDCRVTYESITILPETVYRSQKPLSGQLSFVRGIKQGQCISGSQPVTLIRPGERRIFFLVEESERLRAYVDVFATSLLLSPPVGKGRTTTAEADVDRQIGLALVNPQPGEDVDIFAQYAEHHALRTIDALMGPVKARQLLLSVYQSNSNVNVRAYVCSWLYATSLFGDDCVNEVDGNLSGLSMRARSKVVETQRVFGGGKRDELDDFLLESVQWTQAKLSAFSE